MTVLTNLSPAASYGDLITCTNNGGGLTSSLQNIQDGFGNNSAIQLSTTTLNVIGTLQIGGVAITTPLLVTGSLTSAEILALYNTPIQVLAAPGGGLGIIITRVVFELVYGTTAYGSGGNVFLQYGATAHAANPNYATASAGVPAAFLYNTSNFVLQVDGSINGTTGLASTSVINQAVTITNGTGLFATGNGTLNYAISYYVVSLT